MKKLAGKTTMTTQSAMPLHSLCAFNVGQRAVTRGSNHFVRRLRGVRWRRLMIFSVVLTGLTGVWAVVAWLNQCYCWARIRRTVGDFTQNPCLFLILLKQS
jgi:hypothetical protein